MAKISVTCPECDAKIQLKSRKELGTEKPCPVCGVKVELSLESNEVTYGLNMSPFGGGKSERSQEKPKIAAAGRSTKRNPRRETRSQPKPRTQTPQPRETLTPTEDGSPPMLKRGMYREMRNTSTNDEADDYKATRRRASGGSSDNFLADNAKLIAVGIVVSVLFGVGISIWLPSAIAPDSQNDAAANNPDAPPNDNSERM